MQFTVVGFHEEDGHTICEHVEAKDSNDAVVVASKIAVKYLDKCGLEANYSLENINIVDIFNGHVESVCDCTTVSSARDWPGLDD